MTSASESPMSLAGSEWGYAGENGPNERFVQFGGDGSVNGSGGCNRFAGAYTENGTEIAITKMRVTMMACLDETVMQREAAFLKVLTESRRIEATHLVLKLLGAEGNLLAELARRDFD